MMRQCCLQAAARLVKRPNPQRLYSLAIARDIPDSFVDALDDLHAAQSPHNDAEFFDIERARLQHTAYITALRSILPVLTLPALPEHPDCCFVEDTVVAIGHRAVVTRLGHASRQGEVDSMLAVLQQLGMEVADMRKGSPATATCDGGDVLYTGRHLFVGLSKRTNLDGAKFLEQTFGRCTGGEIDVVVVPSVLQGSQVLHLKSAVTQMDGHSLLAPTGKAVDQLLAAMQATERGYNVYRLPNMLSCNVIACNGVIFAQDSTSCVQSRRTLEKAVLERSMDLMFVDTSELAKKDAALTCCSVLLDI